MLNDLELTLPEICTTGTIPTMQLPDAGEYNYWDFYTNRILTIDGEITDWDYNIAKSIIGYNMHSTDNSPIVLLINSIGGLLDVTYSIIDTIKISRIPVWTVNMGQALSGGCMIFLAGEKRFTLPHSWCMTHMGSGGTSGNYDQSKEQQKVWDEQVKNMGEYIMSQSGIDDKTWRKYKNKDWWLNSEQQLEFGFATDKLEDIDQILSMGT